MTELQIKGKKAKETAIFLRKASSDKKNKVLIRAAALLLEKQADIIASNKIDLKNAADNGITGPLLDRLVLNKTRIEGMAEGLKEIAALADPVGEVLQMEKRPNGLIIGKQRVPIGVIGIIFESRPNVTVDAFGLCLKTGNASILRGGKEAIKTNLTLGKILQQALLDVESS